MVRSYKEWIHMARFITLLALIATALALPLSTYAQAAVPVGAAGGSCPAPASDEGAMAFGA